MFGHGANLIFFNKTKIERPEYSLSPTPLRPIMSHFCLTPSPPPLPPDPKAKVDVICVSTLTERLFRYFACGLY